MTESFTPFFQYMKVCSECGAANNASQQHGSYIDYGWSFNALQLGHYGGFTDNWPGRYTEPDDPRYLIHLCHDCCLKMIEALPNAFREHLGTLGCHPGDLEKPSCCQYAWTFDITDRSKSYRGDGLGGWTLVSENDSDVPLTNG